MNRKRRGMSLDDEERIDTTNRQWGKKKGEEDSGTGDIRAVGNVIYYYADVDHGSILTLNEKIRKVGQEMRKRAIEENREPTGIELRIHSYGGEVFSGIAGMETIRNSPVPVTTIIEGGAASAATFLSVVGSKRLITRNSFMLIHQLSSFMWGKYEDFKDEMKNLDKLMQLIKDVYAEYTKIPMAKIEEILKHDLWFTAGESIEYGLVDEIEG
jgi:ATP-dependent protease ClpP protease subunit